MQSGKLNYLVTLQNPVEVTDAEGASTLSYPTTFAQIWMEVIPRTGAGEPTLSLVERGVTTYFCRSRFISGVSTRTRILWEGNTLEVLHVSDPTGKQRELQWVCSQGEST